MVHLSYGTVPVWKCLFCQPVAKTLMHVLSPGNFFHPTWNWSCHGKIAIAIVYIWNKTPTREMSNCGNNYYSSQCGSGFYGGMQRFRYAQCYPTNISESRDVFMPTFVFVPSFTLKANERKKMRKKKLPQLDEELELIGLLYNTSYRIAQCKGY